MQMTQNVTDAKVQIQSSRQNVTTELSDGTVTAKYLDEDATFSMTFNSNVDYHLNSYSVKYRTKRDYSYAAQYDRFTVAQTRTYYKLVTKSDSSDGSAEFEAAVRKIYGPDCNESVLMAKNKDGNHTFSIAVANAAKETEYQLYQPGMKLPLMTDGKEVVRVDMLTVSEGDLYISGEGRFWDSNRRTFALNMRQQSSRYIVISLVTLRRGYFRRQLFWKAEKICPRMQSLQMIQS